MPPHPHRRRRRSVVLRLVSMVKALVFALFAASVVVVGTYE